MLLRRALQMYEWKDEMSDSMRRNRAKKACIIQNEKKMMFEMQNAPQIEITNFKWLKKYCVQSAFYIENRRNNSV